jgi:UDP-N-acetylmuramate--alanine ligase
MHTGNTILRDKLVTGTGHVHLAGICGVGMAGLALLLKARGFRVSGCDLMVNRLACWLRERGIPVSERHSAAHLNEDVDWVIRSAAVPDSSDEIKAALARGLPVFKRGEVLPALLAGTSSIAVAGTHGKTTTSSFIAQTLLRAGLAPSFCIGGEVDVLGGVAGIGTGGLTVAEADESDGTLALYQPEVAIITNIEFDHMEHFASIEAFEACFRSFVRQTRRRIIYCIDDTRAARVCSGEPLGLSYGFSSEASLRAFITEEAATSSRFDVLFRGQALGSFTVSAPGRHNVLNMLACMAVGIEYGLDTGLLREALAHVTLPRRRFERIIERDDLVVISDYAHHPSEIAALVKTARQLNRSRLFAVFQPHRYTRTLALGANFPAAFEGVDEVVLCPVYAASEAPLPGGSIWDLYAHCRKAGLQRVSVASSLMNAWQYCRDQMRLDDLFLVIGAGDVERIGGWAREELGRRRVQDLDTLVGRAIREIDLQSTLIKGREPMARHTTLGVGGCADLWMEVNTEPDLLNIAAWARRESIPFRIIGGGSNILVSDLGVRGVVTRLSGESFKNISERDGLIVAGAGASLTRLINWTGQHGLSGLEFLESIPGTVGGAVRGNAGAWGHAVAESIAWVRCLDPDNRICTLSPDTLNFGYRSCPALQDQIVLEVAFRLVPVDDTTPRAQRDEIARRREWMRGLRSAGSIFKNPPGKHAGHLIEQAGLKGFSIGGASILERHANIIVTGPGATASDVRAILEKARDEVLRLSGIRLETEIQFLE